MKFTFAEADKTESLNKHWQMGVGSGHASLAMRTDYTEQLKFIHDELNIKSVRFHGIFDDDMHTLHRVTDLYPLPGGRKYTEQSFRLCGLVYDNVLSTGMKPLIELSFMPKMLAKHPFQKGLFYYRPIISLPKNDAVWINYIKDFINFLVKRYGKEEVESWRYEVWNEPDLFGIFYYGKQKDYFHFYEITARAVKDIIPNCKIGGPVSAECRWIKEFKDFCDKNNVPVDFISSHQYSGDPLSGVEAQGNSPEKKSNPIDFVGILKTAMRPFKNAKDKTFLEGYRSFMADKSEINDIPNDTFIGNAKIVRKQAGNLPVYYTEWNESAILTAYTNDTTKVSAYIVKTAVDIANYTDGSAIWCFSDIFEEAHPFPEEFHGGFGLLTQHGVPKPSFYAVKILNELGEQRYIFDDKKTMRGEVTFIACKSKNGIQIVLTRQKLKNLKLPSEHIDIEIKTDTKPTSVTVEKIDENHGNPYKLWLEDGKPMDMTKQEVENLKERSKMIEEDLPYSYENGTLKINADLFVNDVWLIKIKK